MIFTEFHSDSIFLDSLRSILQDSSRYERDLLNKRKRVAKDRANLQTVMLSDPCEGGKERKKVG